MTELRKITSEKDWKMNQRGAVTDIFLWMIVAFVLVIFLGGIIYGFNLLTTALEDVENPVASPNVNITEAVEKTIVPINTGLNVFRVGSFLIIFGLGLSIIFGNFFVKSHPAFFIFYLLIVIIAIITSIYVANTYNDLVNQGTAYTDVLGSFKGSSWILLNLPVWTTIIGLIGGIFLYVSMTRDDDLGGGFG